MIIDEAVPGRHNGSSDYFPSKVADIGEQVKIEDAHDHKASVDFLLLSIKNSPQAFYSWAINTAALINQIATLVSF